MKRLTIATGIAAIAIALGLVAAPVASASTQSYVDELDAARKHLCPGAGS